MKWMMHQSARSLGFRATTRQSIWNRSVFRAEVVFHRPGSLRAPSRTELGAGFVRRAVDQVMDAAPDADPSWPENISRAVPGALSLRLRPIPRTILSTRSHRRHWRSRSFITWTKSSGGAVTRVCYVNNSVTWLTNCSAVSIAAPARSSGTSISDPTP
jgi:hypothetical protein